MINIIIIILLFLICFLKPKFPLISHFVKINQQCVFYECCIISFFKECVHILGGFVERGEGMGVVHHSLNTHQIIIIYQNNDFLVTI